jgi:2-polyprenyl-3-methyl-5-hydroxy-6-metoxy-1,4-benzoquinol methylase
MEYEYSHTKPTWDDSYVWRSVERAVSSRHWTDKRAFDLGCGNGFQADRLARLGFRVAGIDQSESGIALAQRSFPQLDLRVGSAYEDLAAQFGTFPLVLSIEVIEHLINPKLYAKRFYDLLEPGGMGIISTPYHGWIKNVVISISGKWDSHHDVLWDGGHVKFFSVSKLTELLRQAGFAINSVERVGRIPPVAKSIVMVFSK